MREYRVIYSGRRSVALEITRDGEIIVRAPLPMPQSEIQQFVAAHDKWIDKHLALQQLRRQAHPVPDQEQVEALRRMAKALLPRKVEYYGKLMGVQPTAIHITAARTRFGSCSGKNSISFSLYLMQYPDEAIDYVVVHELAHIRHHNHSPAFYAEVAQILPDYQQRRQLLKE